jgi:hypothetical protein
MAAPTTWSCMFKLVADQERVTDELRADAYDIECATV